jgi:hypothetical protein
MIRYGKMRGRNVPSPFSAADFMSQHELLARVVVGRVDDDTAQARDAALFVPTIFVDNPWSKLVGRQMQGFPKGLAEFRALVDDAAHFPVPLAMDGTERDNPGGHPIPFYRITEVHLTTRVDEEQEPQPMKPGLQDASRVKNRILKVECDDIADGSALEFTGPDLTSVFSSIAARRSPWDQFDFDEAEFRRAFAQSIVVGNGFRGFRVVQVSPVDPSVKLEKAWILGRYTLSNVRVAFPTKGATLVFFSPDSAPQTWKALCAQLPGAEVALSTGNWYRVKCSMELQFDDGLDW